VLRHFEIVACDEDEADYNYRGQYSYGPIKVVEISL
jgi:hypothetical protein